jgi:hypothetical protein
LIEITRRQARLFRALLRKSVLAADPRGPCPLVVCRSGRQGLYLYCRQGPTALRHQVPGSRPSSTVALPASLLARLEGPGDSPVRLEQTGPFKGSASWQEADGPEAIDFDTAEPGSLPPPPTPAPGAVTMEPDFLPALAEAARTASHEVGRRSLSQVLLRRDGSLVGTDGRQLLVQGGFSFPWDEDLLVPALPAFGCRELPRDEPASLGRKGDQVTLEVGPWLLSLEAGPAKGYPDVDRVIPATDTGCTRLLLGEADADVLTRELPGLPGRDEDHSPVTLALGPSPYVAASDGQGPVAEVHLAHSRVEGRPLRAVMDRRYLLRAVRLGFRELSVVEPDHPLVCRDGRRVYVWMPLDPATAVVPGQLSRPKEATNGENKPERKPEPRIDPMPSNGNPADDRSHPLSCGDEPLDTLADAEALRARLQEASACVGRLIAVLKQQRRQHRAVQSAVASLRRLQGLGQ